VSLEREIDEDLQRSLGGGVLYVEGQTDLAAFFALLGRPAPADDVVDRVLVKQVRGSRGVQDRVEVADRTGRKRVFGIIDGDGRDRAHLDAVFTGPGPLFAWRAYAIENLVVRAGWPPAWGDPPDWSDVIRRHSAVVAGRRLAHELQHTLRDLTKLGRAGSDGWPHGRDHVRAAILAVQRTLAGRDLGAEFDALVTRFEAMTEDEAHCWLDGKWLIHHVAAERRRRHDEVRQEWLSHVATVGHPDAQDLWRRILAVR
jgi:hypothetical protein